MADRNGSFAVIGLGAFGSTVATELAQMGGYVLGIDSDEHRVTRIADQLAEAKILDAKDEAALREAGLERYGAVVVAIGENIESSVLATMNARLIGCDTIWAKAKDRTHHRILAKVGADRVLMPEQDFGQHTARMLYTPAVRDYISLGNGYVAVNIAVPERLDGQPLPALGLDPKADIRVLGLMRGTKYFSGTETGLTLATDDRLLLLGTRPDLRQFGATL